MRLVVIMMWAVAGCAADPMDMQDAGIDLASGDLRPACASMFGNALTNAFGRLDGTVRAVVRPADPECAMPNGTHLVLQVDSGGQAYRMVVNVESDRMVADPRVSLDEVDAALPSPAWADGWHPGLQLDYAKDLVAHASQFQPFARDDLVSRIATQLVAGDPVSVYATSSGGDSAHLVHRNGVAADGAIVIKPSGGAPHWLLMRFADQTF